MGNTQIQEILQRIVNLTRDSYSSADLRLVKIEMTATAALDALYAERRRAEERAMHARDVHPPKRTSDGDIIFA